MRVRHVLEENLETDLDRVRPDDRLDDDLNAQISTNVDLFWQFEKEFHIDCQVEYLEVFEKTTSQFVTFTDLVGYVRKKIDEQSKIGDEDRVTVSNEAGVDWQDVIGYSWFGEIAIWVASSMFDVDWLMTVALTMALLPITLGIAYRVFQDLSEIARIVRANGLGVLLQIPLPLIVWLALFTPFLMVGIFLMWVLFNLYFGSEQSVDLNVH